MVWLEKKIGMRRKIAMKIVHVISAFQNGGAEQVAINLVIGLSKKGHECCVVTITKPSRYNDVGEELKSRLRKHNVDFFEFGGTNFRLSALYCPFQLRYFFQKWHPDLVHSHTDIPDFMVSLATRFSTFKIVRTIHNTVLWIPHQLMGWVCESGFQDDLIVSISDGTSDAYDQLRLKYRLRASNHQAKIPNGIPHVVGEAPSTNHLDLIKRIRAEKPKHLFCFAGRLTLQKGFDILLDALEKMPRSYREKVGIHAFGDGKEREFYLMRIKDKSLPVIIHPPVAGVREIFPEFDAVIMPSRYEGFALVSLEALAGGVPVIGTRAPGLIETFPPEWPLTVPIENPDALSRLIIKFIDGAFDIKQLKKTAKNWGEQFTISRMVDAYENAYQDFLIP